MTQSSGKFTLASELFQRGVNSPIRNYGPKPRYVSRGEGSRIFDIDGNIYTDYRPACGSLILGRAHPSMKRALERAGKTGINFRASTEYEVELGSAIKSAIPMIQKIQFSSYVTEATMHAVSLARPYTNRKGIVKAEGFLHGSQDYAPLKAGRVVLTHGIHSSPGIPEELYGDVSIARFSDIGSFMKIFHESKDADCLLAATGGFLRQ